MTEEDSRSKNILAGIGVLTVIGVVMLSGAAVLKYGMIPLFEFLSNLVSLSRYQQGVVDTMALGLALLLFFLSISIGPRNTSSINRL